MARDNFKCTECGAKRKADQRRDGRWTKWRLTCGDRCAKIRKHSLQRERRLFARQLDRVARLTG